MHDRTDKLAGAYCSGGFCLRGDPEKRKTLLFAGRGFGWDNAAGSTEMEEKKPADDDGAAYDGGGVHGFAGDEKPHEACQKGRHKHVVADGGGVLRLCKGLGPGDESDGAGENAQDQNVEERDRRGTFQVADSSGEEQGQHGCPHEDGKHGGLQGGIDAGQPALEEIVNAQKRRGGDQPRDSPVYHEAAAQHRQNQDPRKGNADGRPLQGTQGFFYGEAGKERGDDGGEGNNYAAGGGAHRYAAYVEGNHVEEKAGSPGNDKPRKILLFRRLNLPRERKDQQNHGSGEIPQKAQGKRGEIPQGQAGEDIGQRPEYNRGGGVGVEAVFPFHRHSRFRPVWLTRIRAGYYADCSTKRRNLVA